MEPSQCLSPQEARLFGVLIEKSLTTPDQYPLTLNAATHGSNQKSNREPVMNLDEEEVAAALESLVRKYMARRVFPGNSRVEKFLHNGKDALGLEAPALAVLAELLMRGPQSPGELRVRCNRMAPIATLEELQGLVDQLLGKGLVQRIPPSPGSRSDRYAQLLCPDPQGPGLSTEAPMPGPGNVVETLESRLQNLEARVARLEDALAAKPSAGQSSDQDAGHLR